MRRRGFALLAALWLVIGLASLALVATLVARDAVAGSANRRALSRAFWRAEGCAERVRAAATDALRGSGGVGSATEAWLGLPDAVAAPGAVPSEACTVEWRAAGTQLDVNAATEAQLAALLRAAGIPSPRSDSLVDALADWRDADDEPRPLGAERAWYEAAGRHPPRNGPLADPRELHRVRGFEALGPPLDTLLGTEPGRLALALAPVEVVFALSGMPASAVAHLAELRARGVRVASVDELAASLPPEVQPQVQGMPMDARPSLAEGADAWIVTLRARDDASGIDAIVELRLVRAGERVAVVRRRVRA